MDSQLQSISKIFTEKLYRIPDYQRGYAWTAKQLKDFWNDIQQLDEGKNHYVGVLTVEKVPKAKHDIWQEDNWIIQSKSHEPYYIVDGQQRITTTIILIQAITEVVAAGIKLNYSTIEEIKKRYIFDSKDDGISRSYIFGYEKDNPSYEFLKTRIFLENSPSGYINEETIYTQNLYPSGEPLLFRVDVVNNFVAKEDMVKDNSVREQMFASITSWLSSDLSQKQWCQNQGITYHIFHYWYRKYRDEHPESTGDNSFVRLTVTPEASVSCEIIFTDGTKIIFREAVPAQYLKSLLF